MDPIEPKSDIISPGDVGRVFDETAERATRLQRKYLESAQHCGRISTTLRNVTPFWMALAEHTSSNADYSDVLNSGIANVATIGNALKGIEAESPAPASQLKQVAISVCTFGANTAASGVTMGPELSQFDFGRMFVADAEREVGLSDRFSKFDPVLGRLCSQIWETLYGTVSDPERGATFMIRQVWDHLFDKLAPDDEVRRSRFFTKKPSPQPDQVTRRERVQFAVDRHIPESKKQLILAATDQMLVYYKIFNRVHERGDLDRHKLQAALKYVYDWLAQWADALGL
jgi:Predicted pPIWI-associating nuclease